MERHYWCQARPQMPDRPRVHLKNGKWLQGPWTMRGPVGHVYKSPCRRVLEPYPAMLKEGSFLIIHPSIHPSWYYARGYWFICGLKPLTERSWIHTYNPSICPSIHPSFRPSILPSFLHGAPRWLLPKTCPATLTYRKKAPHFSSINFIHPSWCAGGYWFPCTLIP